MDMAYYIQDTGTEWEMEKEDYYISYVEDYRNSEYGNFTIGNYYLLLLF